MWPWSFSLLHSKDVKDCQKGFDVANAAKQPLPEVGRWRQELADSGATLHVSWRGLCIQAEPADLSVKNYGNRGHKVRNPVPAPIPQEQST